MDRIVIRGLRAVGVHGALPEEQVRAQPFEVDVSLALDLATAGASDDLADTVDYGALCEAIAAVVEGERFALLERLAERIAAVCSTDPRVLEIEVEVRKLRPPVGADVAHVAVRVKRP